MYVSYFIVKGLTVAKLKSSTTKKRKTTVHQEYTQWLQTFTKSKDKTTSFISSKIKITLNTTNKRKHDLYL